MAKRDRHDSGEQQRQTIEHVASAPCSIEFTRGPKGEPRWTIKLYGELENMESVVDRLEAIDATLDEKFPGRTKA